jgi:hypothetical protein
MNFLIKDFGTIFLDQGRGLHKGLWIRQINAIRMETRIAYNFYVFILGLSASWLPR